MPQPAYVRHAFFPGTFDPVTLGHLDLVQRSLALFGRLTIAVAHNPGKSTLFGPEQRVELLREATQGLPGVEVVLIDGLVVQACEKLAADVIVRGVRSGTDFDYEVQMARTNRAMLPRIDTVLLAPSPAHAHISSTLVREIATLGGDASAFVPANVARALRERRPGRGS
jgi:pantetheine-phosphate adenylyltransferase